LYLFVFSFQHNIPRSKIKVVVRMYIQIQIHLQFLQICIICEYNIDIIVYRMIHSSLLNLKGGNRINTTLFEMSLIRFYQTFPNGSMYYIFLLKKYELKIIYITDKIILTQNCIVNLPFHPSESYPSS
jgi:hypothetical protein